jgi:hypothetical protein
VENRIHFAHHVDAWDDDGQNVIEHLAGVEDFELAMATYRAARQRWPNATINLRQSARVIQDSRLCVPKIRFCDIGDEDRRGPAVM